MAEWSLWLDEHLLAAVPHRQVVLTIPMGPRGYFRKINVGTRVEAPAHAVA